VGDEQQGLVVGELHAMHLLGMTLDHHDEPFFVRRAGYEPAFALKHVVHDSSGRT
jgi:hypothetical protein